MPRRNRKRNSKAKRARRTRRDTHSNHLHTVQSGNASDVRGVVATSLGNNSPVTSSRASSPESSAHASPIYSLPPELLCEIFILALPTDEELEEQRDDRGAGRGDESTEPLVGSSGTCNASLFMFNYTLGSCNLFNVQSNCVGKSERDSQVLLPSSA
ncbi:hypothetical protein F5887DRAFT_1168433 [Amanita rubescens]|nr:hypothetical protein F5887DRAFT_1168433 [Amanita rubescens]